MLAVSALEELGVLAVVLGDLLPGEGRLLKDDLLPDSEGPLPKDKMGEESRDRVWEGDATDVFKVGVVGELIPVLLSTWAEEVNTFGTVIGKASPPLVLDGDVGFGGESGEAPGQLEGETEDVGEREGPVFHIGRPLGKRGGDDIGEKPLSQFFMRGVPSPGSSSLSTVDWRVGMLVTDFEATKRCGCSASSISKLSSLRAV